MVEGTPYRESCNRAQKERRQRRSWRPAPRGASKWLASCAHKTRRCVRKNPTDALLRQREEQQRPDRRRRTALKFQQYPCGAPGKDSAWVSKTTPEEAKCPERPSW